MNTSQTTSLIKEISNDNRIPPEDLSYERERLRNAIHQFVLRVFIDESKRGPLTRAAMARRLGKKQEQVTRWLGAPGNWTIDTISDLLRAMERDPSELINGSRHSERSNIAHALAARIYTGEAIARGQEPTSPRHQPTRTGSAQSAMGRLHAKERKGAIDVLQAGKRDKRIKPSAGAIDKMSVLS